MTKVKIVERVENLEEYSEEVKTALPNKLDKREIDDTPVLGSGGLVTSDGIFKALDKKQDNLIIDHQLSNTSLNPIANSTVATELNSLKNRIEYVNNSVASSKGIEVFNTSCTFIVPSNVRAIRVTCIGGGGGAGRSGGANKGGDTSFGSYMTAYGGIGGTTANYGGSFKTSVGGIGFQGQAGSGDDKSIAYAITYLGNPSFIFGTGGRQGVQGRGGGAGGSITAAINNLTPGETINVIVGGGGWGEYGAGVSGVCIVEW